MDTFVFKKHYICIILFEKYLNASHSVYPKETPEIFYYTLSRDDSAPLLLYNQFSNARPFVILILHLRRSVVSRE